MDDFEIKCPDCGKILTNQNVLTPPLVEQVEQLEAKVKELEGQIDDLTRPRAVRPIQPETPGEVLTDEVKEAENA